MSRAGADRSTVWAQAMRMFRWDLRYQLRDPRTLFLTILTPILLAPAMIWLGQSGDDRQEGPFVVAAPAAFAAWTEDADRLVVIAGTLEAPGAPHRPDAIDPETDITQPLAEVELPAGPDDAYVVRYKGARIEGAAALDRVRSVLRRQDETRRAERFAELGLPPPDRILAAEVRDAASAEARGGDLLGRLVPVMLLLLLMTGGLHTALDIITGERERGTLETLLSAPVERRAVLYAKGLSVLVTAGLSTLLALVGLAASAAIFDLGLDGDLALAPGRVALAGGLMLPLVVTLTAGLMLLAARVPDYKAGQFLSAPAMLIGLLPAAVAALPEVELTALLALLPITGIALAVRAVLSGVADGVLVGLAFAAAVIHAGVAIRIAGGALTGERFLLGPPDRRARHARGDYAIEAIAVFLLSLLCLWFFGQTAQSLDLAIGMVVTQVVTLAGVALAAIAWLGRPMAETLQLRAPRGADLALAVVAGLAATGIGQLVFVLQAPLIPIPESFLRQFEGQFEGFGLAEALLLFALLPGVCEEILFRGALLGLLRRRFGPLALCLLIGALFGLMHLAVPRLLPTGVLGVLLTWAALRSGSLWVPVVMHAVHNGLLFTLALTGVVPEGETVLPAFGLLGLAALAVGAVWLMRGVTPRRATPSAEPVL